MAQLELFRGAVTSPAARSNSAMSHDEMEASGAAEDQRETVAWVLAGHPGRTASELAVHAGDEGHELDRYQFGRRLPELVKLGRAVKGYSRRCEVTERMAATWLPKRGGA